MSYQAKSETTINAPIEKVWQTLTDPELVKQWLFGTEMSVSEWAVGGKISYKGVWEGKTYEDKGEILELVPEQKLASTYWSGMSGLPDVPENYQKVSYILSEANDGTKLTIIQEGNPTEESAKHSESNWNTVLESFKKLAENS
ncbi:MAG TPA: SRPBCC domain-containing protein [Patescibacteria group bacterium]|nr:SRPBCC domain-containing protein [Patescibacteria group bacterium]